MLTVNIKNSSAVKVSDMKFLTFPLNSFKQSGEQGRSSLWKGKLFRQVQHTETWRGKQTVNKGDFQKDKKKNRLNLHKLPT